VVMGHSTGGFMAAFAASHDEGLLGVALISPGGPGRIGLLKREQAIKVIDDNIGTTAGMRTVNTSPEALADEAIRNASDWNITAWGPGLAKHPLLIVSANDGLAPANEALRDSAANGQPVTYLHLDTDHSYSDHRIALEAAVIRWLENLPGAPAGL